MLIWRARNLSASGLFLLLLSVTVFSPTPAALAENLELDARDPSRDVRAALFQADGFPTVDAPELSGLGATLAGLPVDTLGSVDALREELRLRSYDVLILPYGSAFPLAAWDELRSFVGGGGGLVVLGGAPFQQPVLQGAEGDGDGGFRLGVRQPTFAKALGLGSMDVWTRDGQGPIGTTGKVDLKAEANVEHGWNRAGEVPQTVWQPILRLASVKDMPDESGSEGYRDGILRPLVHVMDGETGLPVATPIVEIDRIRGPEAGARWILAPSDAALDSATIRALVERALLGASQLDALPVHATVHEGETPRIKITWRRPFVRQGEEAPSSAEIVLRNDAGDEIFRAQVPLSGVPEMVHGLVAVETDAPLAPGLYHGEVSVDGAFATPRTTTVGFWQRDAELLASGPKITVSRDWLRRDGEVMPVLGTTYMSSDVQRKFLIEPNPSVWDQDFAQMASMGVNMVRTGTWTGWTRSMLGTGELDEAFVRSLEAYVMTAAKHDIVVNYTFFVFLPPAYGGDNPYLDPRSLDGQRQLLTQVATRFRDVGWVHWDLINEPSYAPPAQLWSAEPMRDIWERREWLRMLEDRHGDGAEPSTEVLRNRWQDSTRWVTNIPSSNEWGYTALRLGKRPRKARDLMILTHEIVAGWADRLRTILRQAGGDVLVTLGQDEGGIFTRPSQQIHGELVDYTAVHPWWQNDQLLASGLFAKIPEKPMLFQETGIMALEDMDGNAWRNPERAARLLERKFAYAFAARGAGVIEWAWNINPYQPIDNEGVIGFLRPDGTAKPELRVLPEFVRFFEQAAPHLDDFDADPVIAVIPHSRLYSGRPGGAEGLKRLIRVSAERFGVVPTVLSELRLTAECLKDAKLILVPGPFMLEDSASKALAAAAAAGTKVLFTGAVTGNPYGELTEAFESLGIESASRPVEFREAAAAGWVTFDGNKREQFRRAEGSGTAPSADAAIWHDPLPLEFGREDGPLAALLASAFEVAGVETQPSDAPVALRLLPGPKSVLAVLVNETAQDLEREVEVAGRKHQIMVPSGRSSLVLYDRKTGEILASSR